MIGQRVRHAGGVGTVTHVGEMGVTVDDVHKVPHGEHVPHDDSTDPAALARGHDTWKEALPEQLARGPNTRTGVLAMMSVLADVGSGGDAATPEVLKLVKPMLAVVKQRPGFGVFLVPSRDGHMEELSDDDLDDYLQTFGLSRAGLGRHVSNRQAVEHAHGLRAKPPDRAEEVDPALRGRLANPASRAGVEGRSGADLLGMHLRAMEKPDAPQDARAPGAGPKQPAADPQGRLPDHGQPR